MKTTVTFSFAILLSTCLAVTSFAEESTAKTEAKPATTKQNPAGTWRLEYDFGGTLVKDAFRLNLGKENELLGMLHRNDSKLKLQDGKFEDNTISFTVTAEYEGTEWVTKYAGKVDGDSLEGTAVVTGNGQSFEFPWTPKRSVEKEDLVGEWQLHIETPDGEKFDPILKVSIDGDKLTSKYGGAGGLGELEVQNLRLEKSELCFSIETVYTGVPIKLDYHGRPYGDEINGAIDYAFQGNTGEIPFTAKRKASESASQK